MKKINKQVILLFIIVINSVFAETNDIFNTATNKYNNTVNYIDSGSQCIISENNSSINNNIPDDYYMDNNDQCVLCNQNDTFILE